MCSALSGLNKNGSGSSGTVTMVLHFLDAVIITEV